MNLFLYISKNPDYLIYGGTIGGVGGTGEIKYENR